MNAPTMLLILIGKLALGAMFLFILTSFGLWLGRISFLNARDE